MARSLTCAGSAPGRQPRPSDALEVLGPAVARAGTHQPAPSRMTSRNSDVREVHEARARRRREGTAAEERLDELA